jgi:drug/metabolite transporter (DMT)-like permease
MILMRASQTWRGAVLVCAAMMMFVQNDVVTKLLTARFPALQVMSVRGLMGGGLLLVFLRITGAALPWRRALEGPVLARSACDAAASIAFVFALVGLPLATITAIIQVVPVLSAVLAALLFKEVLTRRLLLSMGLGLSGVMVFARPTGGPLDHHLLLAGICAFLLCARDLITRKTATDIPSSLVALLTTLAVPFVAAPFLFLTGVHPMALSDIGVLMVAAACVSFGNWFLVLAIRTTTLGAIAPFRYLAIPISMLAGILVWSEVPTLSMVSGGALIAIGGAVALAAPAKRDSCELVATAPNGDRL